MQLFDEYQLHLNHQRADFSSQKNQFLIKDTEEELLARSQCLSLHSNSILINGARTDLIYNTYKNTKISLLNPYHTVSCNNQQYMLSPPLIDFSNHSILKGTSFDLIIDCLTLHTVNDLPQLLKDYYQLLNKKGYFLAALYGGETLRELRESLLQTEVEIYQGASLRIIPMISLETSLKLMQNSGFINTIVDKEVINVECKSLIDILKYIKNNGDSQPFLNSPLPLSYLHFKAAEDHYQQKYSNKDSKNLKITCEIIYLLGQK